MSRKLPQGVGHEFQSLSTTCNRDAAPASRNIWLTTYRDRDATIVTQRLGWAYMKIPCRRTKSSKPVSDATAPLTDARKVRGKQGYAK
ncbi:hypothetical protein EAE99_004618 [Botrytis elliptica]|nr:hypothetical protein EAE99_004618 [Botrytis elliptica]